MGLFKTVIVYLLTFVFLMSGGNKITDSIHKETHQTLAKDCKTVWGPFFKPIFVKTLNLPPDMIKVVLDDGSNTYGVFLKNLGILNVVCATLLMTPLRPLAAIVLAALMAGAVYMHHTVNDGKMPVPGALLAMCVLVLIPSAEKEKKAKKA